MGGKKAVDKSREWEKFRRDKLNIGFDELCKLLPDHDPSMKLSKMEILKKAAEYIKQLQEQNENIIKCGSSNGLKNETERLRKRVAYLLLKTKELVTALRSAGVPIPKNKTKKKPTKTKNQNVPSITPTSSKRVKCGCDKKFNPKKPLTELQPSGAKSLPTTSQITPVLQPINIDKTVLSNLGPGTLILADGRVVNVPPIVPQLVVKPQPTVLVLSSVSGPTKEKIIAPKKFDITKTTYANKAPIPAIIRLDTKVTKKAAKKTKKVVPKISKNDKKHTIDSLCNKDKKEVEKEKEPEKDKVETEVQVQVEPEPEKVPVPEPEPEKTAECQEIQPEEPIQAPEPQIETETPIENVPIESNQIEATCNEPQIETTCYNQNQGFENKTYEGAREPEFFADKPATCEQYTEMGTINKILPEKNYEATNCDNIQDIQQFVDTNAPTAMFNDWNKNKDQQLYEWNKNKNDLNRQYFEPFRDNRRTDDYYPTTKNQYTTQSMTNCTYTTTKAQNYDLQQKDYFSQTTQLQNIYYSNSQTSYTRSNIFSTASTSYAGQQSYQNFSYPDKRRNCDFNINLKEKLPEKEKVYSTNTQGNTFKEDFLRNERNLFMPIIDDVRLNSDFSNDLFSSLQVPTGGQHSDSVSPTAAFLLSFPLVSNSKNSENIETDTNENQNSTPTTILQIGNIEQPSEIFQPIEFGKEINSEYIDVQMKVKRKEPIKDAKKAKNYYYPNYYEQWDKKEKKKDKKTYNYECYKQDRKKKKSVNWMTTPENEMYRETETFTPYNMEVENFTDICQKKNYSWSPTKSALPFDSTLIPSTLPTLVGDLALGTSTDYKKKTPEKTDDKRKGQANFLSVSQLVDPKSKKKTLPVVTKKPEKKRNCNYKRKETQECMYNENFLPNFNFDKRYKGNYSAESLIGTQDMEMNYQHQQNNTYFNEFHDNQNQYQNCFNFPQGHFPGLVADEYHSENFSLNGQRSQEKRPERCRDETYQTGFLQNYPPSYNAAGTSFNLPSTMGNFNVTNMATNTTTTLTNFNLSTIFPEMNDQRTGSSGQQSNHMNAFPTNTNQYRPHTSIQ